MNDPKARAEVTDREWALSMWTEGLDGGHVVTYAVGPREAIEALGDRYTNARIAFLCTRPWYPEEGDKFCDCRQCYVASAVLSEALARAEGRVPRTWTEMMLAENIARGLAA